MNRTSHAVYLALKEWPKVAPGSPKGRATQAQAIQTLATKHGCSESGLYRALRQAGLIHKRG